MAGTLTPTPFQTVLDTDGVAVSGALIYTYVGGTTTAAATYTTSALSVANTNPIVADAAGRFVAYLPAGGNFKFTYKTAAGATIEEQDNILSVPGAAVNLDIEGTVGEAVTAGQVCYLSTGAEATPLTAGLWYLTDADFAPTSTTCQSVGVAVSAIAINTAGTIRLAGTATMATAVVIGSTYYVSATAGAITATPPALSRTVGVALTTSTLLLAATTAVVTPAGSNTQVQFNDSGVLGGDSGFTYIKATDAVAIAGATTVGGTLGVTGLITSTGGITGGASSHTTGAFSSTVTGGTYNSQTISSAANFTGTLAVAGASTFNTSATFAVGGTSSALIDGSSNYNVVSLINSTSLTTNVGIFGGASGDATTLYYIAATGGSHTWRSGVTGDFMTLSSAGLLTVSGFGTHSFSAGGTGYNAISLTNTTSNTTSGAYMGITAGTAYMNLQVLSQGYTTSGPYVQSGGVVDVGTAGGLSIAATNASGAIRFYSGGTTLRGTILTTGQQVMGSSGTVRNSAWLTIDYSGSTYNALSLNDNSSSNGGTFQVFAVGAGTVCGSVSRNGATSAVVYNLTSDKRLKHDLGLATDLSGLRGLAIHDFTWITDESGYRDRGVFAQDAYQVMPRGITPGKTEQDYWQVSYTSYVPDLIVGWQQHDATISQLAARIAALETKDH